MRIVATAVVIAIAATSAGCGGSSSSSSRAPAQAVTQTTAAPARPSAAATRPAAGPTKATSGSGRGANTVLTHLVGRPLDNAEGMLHSAGISYKVIPLHGHVNDATTRWGVCETKPVASRHESPSVVELIVARLKCGGR